jgi:RNA polymerase sigma factor (sigma-70 family)
MYDRRRRDMTLPRSTADSAFRSHERFLWGLCYRMTGSAADADDLVQDTFARAIAQPPPDTTSSLRPWLVRVAMNLARDHLRRRRRRAYDGPWLPAPVDELPPAHEPAATTARYDLMESVTIAFLLALEALSPPQRAVLILRDEVRRRAAEEDRHRQHRLARSIRRQAKERGERLGGEAGEAPHRAGDEEDEHGPAEQEGGGAAVRAAQVLVDPARARQRRRQLGERQRAGQGDHAAGDPHDQVRLDRSGQTRDLGGRLEDPGADRRVHHHQHAEPEAQVATERGFAGGHARIVARPAPYDSSGRRACARGSRRRDRPLPGTMRLRCSGTS